MPAVDLKEKARLIRREIVESTTEAGSGHPSSSLSAVELMVGLYFGGVLRYDPKRPHWPDRDRFILSKGHASPILYAVLAEAGYFPTSELHTLRKLGSPLEGHPNMRRLPGVEASTGSLGQGLSIGLGHALAARVDGRSYHVWVMLGDGECDEGQVWEAAMAGHQFKVDNLTAIVDNNRMQQSGMVADVMNHMPLAEKWRAFGWHAIDVDGHDQDAVLKAFAEAQATKGKPTAIIAHTIKGKGVSFMEPDYTWHGRAIPKEQEAAALKEIG
ncbi:MAG TPA: transketolase [Chloroflexota bacterium]|nr:transketolase [Chloroflexota bacterium]